MSLADPFWNWFWHIFAVVCICAICLPSRYLEKISQRFAMHRALSSDKVHDMKFEQYVIPAQQQDQVVVAYNQANFLYKNPRAPDLSGLATLTWSDSSRGDTYCLAPIGEYIVVTRWRTGRNAGRGQPKTAFTIQSLALQELFTGERPEIAGGEWPAMTSLTRAACGQQGD